MDQEKDKAALEEQEVGKVPSRVYSLGLPRDLSVFLAAVLTLYRVLEDEEILITF